MEDDITTEGNIIMYCIYGKLLRRCLRLVVGILFSWMSVVVVVLAICWYFIELCLIDNAKRFCCLPSTTVCIFRSVVCLSVFDVVQRARMIPHKLFAFLYIHMLRVQAHMVAFFAAFQIYAYKGNCHFDPFIYALYISFIMRRRYNIPFNG